MILHENGVFSFPCHWQIPAATEQAAYEAVTRETFEPGFEYFGFPWATIIDGVRSRSPKAWEVLSALSDVSVLIKSPGGRPRVTVAQHIHTLKFAEMFAAIGITDLFWSHATRRVTQVKGMRIHPFPLFPAQAPTGADRVSPLAPRRYLANFIGAYNPKIYLSDVRQHIFDSAGSRDDLLIIARDAWHFDRAVYEEQVRGLDAREEQLAIEDLRRREYLDAIKQSWFTLCPTGSGPNSIRIFECLALGSIPIILTRDLRLPGPMSLWEKAAIIEDDSGEGFRRSLDSARSLGTQSIQEKLEAGRRLFEVVGPQGYGQLIQKSLLAIESINKVECHE